MIEQSILEKAKILDEKAIAHVYEHYYHMLYKYAFTHSKNQEFAQDVVQEVFIKFIKNVSKACDNLEPWLYKTTKNMLIDSYRKKQLEIKYDIEKAFSKEPEKNENDIIDQIDLLNKEYKEVLTLRFINDKSIKETAKIMMKSEGSIKQMQMRALQKLKIIIRGQSDEN